MKLSDLTARQYYDQVRANPTRQKFGFGARPALINIDLQRAYTSVGEFVTAYETDPRQLEYVNALARLCRANSLPVVWTHVAYLDSAEDAGVWGTRDGDNPDALQNVKIGSARAELDPRLEVDRTKDVVIHKRMASPFHETHLHSLLTWHKIDTVLLTGGSTSGCVRACAIDAISRGYRVIVIEECVADVHESPHFANLTDMLLKYADVESFATVERHLAGWTPSAS